MSELADILRKSPSHSLAISRPVVNYGAAEAGAWKDVLLEPRSSKRDHKRMRDILRPGRTPRAELITSSEFRRFLGSVGHEEGVTKGYIEELAEHMEAVFADAPVTLTARTLPARVSSVRRNRVLSVAGSDQIIAERQQAKAALAKYHGLERVPEDPWVYDAYATRVWLARTHFPEDNAFADQLADEFQNNADLIPRHTEFGRIAVMPITANN